MNPITMLIVGATYGYLAGNPVARRATFKQLQKFTGMAIDGLNKQGGKYAETVEQPKETQE